MKNREEKFAKNGIKGRSGMSFFDPTPDESRQVSCWEPGRKNIFNRLAGVKGEKQRF
jgi:hypothetical protein